MKTFPPLVLTIGLFIFVLQLLINFIDQQAAWYYIIPIIGIALSVLILTLESETDNS